MSYDSDPIDELILSSQETAPNKLWHYTSTTAFINMIKESSFWLTDYRLLNDSTEFHYGIDIFCRQLQSLLNVEQNPRRKILLQRIFQEIERSRKWMRAYVFCMTTNADSLTHWRSYSAHAEPLAIGLNSSLLRLTPWNRYSADLVSIIYDQTAQECLVKRVVELFLEFPQCRSFLESDTPNIDSMNFDVFTLRCCDLCVRFKSSQFSDEQEWRLVTRFGLEHGPFSELKYRSNGAGIRPYLEMVSNSKKLPVNYLTIGPLAYRETQVDPHLEFLHRQDYFDVEVQSSTIPWR